MSFSFDPSLGAWRDHARLALGDTDAADPLLADETIDGKIAAFGYLEGLAQLADGLAVQAAQDPDKYAEGQAGLSAQWSQRVAAWRKLADDCRNARIFPPLGTAGRSGVALGQLTVPADDGLRTD